MNYFASRPISYVARAPAARCSLPRRGRKSANAAVTNIDAMRERADARRPSISLRADGLLFRALARARRAFRAACFLAFAAAALRGIFALKLLALPGRR